MIECNWVVSIGVLYSGKLNAWIQTLFARYYIRNFTIYSYTCYKNNICYTYTLLKMLGIALVLTSLFLVLSVLVVIYKITCCDQRTVVSA